MIIRAAFPTPRLLQKGLQLRRCSSASMARPSQRPTLGRKSQLTRSPQYRRYASSSEADSAIEEIQELYATAKDEFEIAAEETEKKTVYAADDRAAAQEELQKLKDAYDAALRESTPEVSGEIKNRVGQRIRELDNAMKAMEESAVEE